MRRTSALLGALCGVLLSLPAPVFAQTGLLRPDGQQVEIEYLGGSAADKADHAQVAYAPNGDFLVVFHGKPAGSDPATVHAVYFSYESSPNPKWVASPSVQLAGIDVNGLRCSRPDVISTYEKGARGAGTFIIAWGRLADWPMWGALEACTITAPPSPGDSPVVGYSDGITGFVLDDMVDTNPGRVRVELAWHLGLGEGHFAGVYNHRVSDWGIGTTMALRWVEATLPTSASVGSILAQGDITGGIPIFGALYTRPGGAFPPTVTFVPNGNGDLRAVMSWEESHADSGIDGARVIVLVSRFTSGSVPYTLSYSILEPDLLTDEKYLHRPKLAWNRLPNQSEQAQLSMFAVESQSNYSFRAGRSYTVYMDSRGVVRDPWTPTTDRQKSVDPVALSTGHAVFYDDGADLHYATGDVFGLSEGSTVLGQGEAPGVDWLENVGPSGEDAVVIVSQRESELISGGPKRVFVQVLIEHL